MQPKKQYERPDLFRARLDQIGNWIVGIKAFHNNPYDGYTEIHIVNFRTMKRLTRAVKKWFKRRTPIEPVFGHVKSDNRMSNIHPHKHDFFSDNYLKSELLHTMVLLDITTPIQIT